MICGALNDRLRDPLKTRAQIDTINLCLMSLKGPIAQPGQSCRLITGWSQVQILVGPHQYDNSHFKTSCLPHAVKREPRRMHCQNRYPG